MTGHDDWALSEAEKERVAQLAGGSDDGQLRAMRSVMTQTDPISSG
jgi:hypothetical protein